MIGAGATPSPTFFASDADIEFVACALSPLTTAALRLMTRRMPNPVALYLALRSEAFERDVDSAGGAAFQRRFNGFYGVRRNSQWRAAYYALFQEAKASQATNREIFDDVLGRLHMETGRVEASFVSKLVATLRPDAPVIDSIVRSFLGALVNAPRFNGGLEAPRAYHLWLDDFLSRLAQSPQALSWASQFDAAFSDCPGASEIHAVKKLDFLIWGGARG